MNKNKYQDKMSSINETWQEVFTQHLSDVTDDDIPAIRESLQSIKDDIDTLLKYTLK